MTRNVEPRRATPPECASDRLTLIADIGRSLEHSVRPRIQTNSTEIRLAPRYANDGLGTIGFALTRGPVMNWLSTIVEFVIPGITTDRVVQVETVALTAAVLIAWFRPRVGSTIFEAIEDRFRRLADRQGRAVLVVGLLAIVLRLALIPVAPVPVPGVHD